MGQFGGGICGGGCCCLPCWEPDCSGLLTISMGVDILIVDALCCVCCWENYFEVVNSFCKYLCH